MLFLDQVKDGAYEPFSEHYKHDLPFPCDPSFYAPGSYLSRGENAFHIAIRNGFVGTVQRMLETAAIDNEFKASLLRAGNSEGYTPLHLLALRPSMAICKLIVVFLQNHYQDRDNWMDIVETLDMRTFSSHLQEDPENTLTSYHEAKTPLQLVRFMGPMTKEGADMASYLASVKSSTLDAILGSRRSPMYGPLRELRFQDVSTPFSLREENEHIHQRKIDSPQGAHYFTFRY